MGVTARRSVLGRRSEAHCRVTVSMVVLVLEVPDHHPGLEQTVPVIAVEALLAQAVGERLDVPVIPRLSG